jgi:hypothetical protein
VVTPFSITALNERPFFRVALALFSWLKDKEGTEGLFQTQSRSRRGLAAVCSRATGDQNRLLGLHLSREANNDTKQLISGVLTKTISSLISVARPNDNLRTDVAAHSPVTDLNGGTSKHILGEVRAVALHRGTGSGCQVVAAAQVL